MLPPALPVLAFVAALTAAVPAPQGAKVLLGPY